MKIDRRIAAIAVCVMAVTLTQCGKSITEPTPRTHSVTATAAIPANPTTPIILSTNDPESHLMTVIDVATAQSIVQSAGGPVTVTINDLAPADFATSGVPAALVAGYTPDWFVVRYAFTTANGASANFTKPISGSLELTVQLTESQKRYPAFKTTDFTWVQSASLVQSVLAADPSPIQSIRMSFKNASNNTLGGSLKALLSTNGLRGGNSIGTVGSPTIGS
jgi:hypothetical protein